MQSSNASAVLEHQDIVSKIFEHLNVRERAKLALTNRLWRSIAMDPQFWLELDLTDHNVSPHHLRNLLLGHPELVHIKAGNIELTTAQLRDILPVLVNVESFAIGKQQFSRVDLNSISASLPRLTTLALHGASFDTIQLQQQQQPPPAIPGHHHHHYHHAFHHHHPPPPPPPFAAAAPPPPPPAAANPQPPPFPGWHGAGGGDDTDDEIEVIDLAGDGDGNHHNTVHQMLQAVVNNANNVPLPDIHHHHHNHHNAGPSILAHPRVENLIVHVGGGNNFQVNCPNLRYMEMQNFTGNNFNLDSTDNLHEIHIVNGTREGNQGMSAILGLKDPVRPYPALERLTIESNSIRDNIIRKCGETHPNISTLILTGCSSLSGSGLNGEQGRWLQLRSLSITDCDFVSGNSLGGALRTLPRLNELQIIGCSNLSTLNIESHSLRRVIFKSPRNLTDLSLVTPYLETFTLESATIDSHIAAILLTKLKICSSILCKLVIAYCPALVNTTLECPELQEISFIDCEELKTCSFFDELAESHQYPYLKSMTITGCTSLSRLTIGGSSSLKSLVVSGCTSMKELSVECPELIFLELIELKELVTFSLASKVIKELHLGNCPELVEAAISAAELHTLDLRGCNQLTVISQLECPKLQFVDASLCGALHDGMIAVLSACPAIKTLDIGVCSAITEHGLAYLGTMESLNYLSLSYMRVSDYMPLLNAAMRVKWLSVTSNYGSNSEAEALCAMLKELYPRSTNLQRLNISYCDVDHVFAAELMVHGFFMENHDNNNTNELVIDGLKPAKEDDELWPLLHVDRSRVSTIKKLGLAQAGFKTFFLGLVPKADFTLVEKNLKVLDHINDDHGVVFTPLEAVEELDLHQGRFTRVAIALPRLRNLSLQLCLSLESVVLHCPLLTHLDLRNCNRMSFESILKLVAACPALESLNVAKCQSVENELIWQGVAAVRAAFCAARPNLVKLEASHRKRAFRLL